MFSVIKLNIMFFSKKKKIEYNVNRHMPHINMINSKY